MSHLVFRIPADVFITSPYQLTRKIQLLPGQRVKEKFGEGERYCCSFLYTESDPPKSTRFQSLPIFVPSYENLRTFLTFWALVEDGGFAITAFETNETGPTFGEIPTEEATHWNNGIREWNPVEMRIRMGIEYSSGVFSLAALYQKFLQADQTLRDLIALSVYQPNRAPNGRRQVYDNHLMQSSIDWIIIDALCPPKRCGGMVSCPKCGGKANLSHVTSSFKERMEADLLRSFPDAADYSRVLDAYRECRSSFFHVGKYEEIPPTDQPTNEVSPGVFQREITMDELISQFRKEGLATQSAAMLLHDIVHCLLLNRLIPELSMWPRFELLKMVSFDSIG